MDNDIKQIIKETTQIVSSYVSNPSVHIAKNELEGIITDVYTCLFNLYEQKTKNEVEVLEPIVPIDQTIHDNYIICLEDGERFKSLKRHLRVQYNMSPEEYRKKWGLPHDYPMVPPNYAKKRSQLAKEIGLGKKM